MSLSAATSATAMQSITNEDECKAAGGSCTNRDDCPLANNVFQEECDGCCIPKETVCASKNGSFMPKSECDLKSGYHDTGLHLGDDNCCAPQTSGGGSGSGNGQGGGNGNGQGGGQGNGQGGGQGSGRGNGQGQGQGSGKGQGNGTAQGNSQGTTNAAGLARLSYLMPVVWGLVCSYRAVA